MAGQQGRALLIKVDIDDLGDFQTVGGLRARSVSLNSEMVDISDGDSTNQWRELLAGAGIRNASISGSGVFKDNAQEETIRGYFFAGTIHDYQFIIPDFGTIEGAFLLTSLDYAGEYNGEVTYSMTFESAGALTWSAA